MILLEMLCDAEYATQQVAFVFYILFNGLQCVWIRKSNTKMLFSIENFVDIRKQSDVLAPWEMQEKKKENAMSAWMREEWRSLKINWQNICDQRHFNQIFRDKKRIFVCLNESCVGQLIQSTLKNITDKHHFQFS